MSGGDNSSAAREALQGHLDAGLSLQKKRSWMYSFREVFQKSALSAKAAVDSIRGETPSRSELETPEPEPEVSNTKNDIPDAIPVPNTPKSAIILLRKHIPGHSKRGSVFSISSRDALGNDYTDADGPDSIHGKPEMNESRHRRRASIADSITGSLRGFRRKSSKPFNPSTPPAKVPAQVPLPSSPIAIPTPAPAPLSLDLGSSNLMSPTFGMDIQRVDDDKRLDADNITAGVPNTFGTHLAERFGPTAGPRTPTPGLLEPPRDSFDFGFSDRPPSPMPGTNLTLEIDGSRDEISQLFERSVVAKKSRPQLRPMRSLDAMAEACTISHRNDDLAKVSVDAGGIADDEASPKERENPQFLRPPVRRDALSSASTSTVQELPADMPELSRQSSTPNPNLGFGACNADGTADYDLFAFSVVASSGPPSPPRSVTLPLRLKDTTNDAKSAEVESQSEVEPELSEAVTSTAMEAMSSMRDAAVIGQGQVSAKAQDATKDQTPKRQKSVVSDPSIYSWPKGTLSSPVNQYSGEQQRHDAESVVTDYDEFKTQQLFGDEENIESPRYDSAEDEHPDSPLDGSPHGGPLIPQLYQHILSPQQSSPIARTTDVGEVFWKFTAGAWLSDSADEDEGTTTPTRHPPEKSLDEPTDEHDTPTPNMGDKMEFELKRSVRNMRYNALQQQENGSPNTERRRNTSSNFDFKPPKVGDDDAEMQLPDYEQAYSASCEMLPVVEEPQKGHERQASAESIALSLQEVMFDMNQLLEQVENVQEGEESPGQDLLSSPGSGYCADRSSASPMVVAKNKVDV